MDSVLAPVWISLKTAVTATIITFCLGVSAAWWMSQYQGKGKSIIEGVLTAPLVLPPTVVGFLLLLALGKNGFLGRSLNLVGIRVVFSWYATVIAATVVAFPLMYKSALAAFQQIDRPDNTASQRNLIACARTLGASKTTIFWRIILPLAKPGLIAGTLLAFARALGEFGATLMVAGSIPGKTQTIPLAIYLAAESGAMDRALRLVIILLGISLGLIVSINYWDKEKNSYKSRNHRGSSSRSGKGNQNISTEKINLQVDIQKQLPDFLLDISFEIDSAQIPLGILGASGAGKTTLLRCIAGLETPDRGVIRLNHQTLFNSAQGINLPPQEREIGFVFQDYALFPHLTVAENIAFGMSVKQSASAIQQEAIAQLHQVDLTSLKNRFPHQLSGGEQQRIALARALASNPQITLLDEPFSALDANLTTELLKLLQKRLTFYPGLTLYVTHNLTEAYSVCPQLLVIDRGKAIAFGTRQEIFNQPPNWQTAQLMGCNNFSQAKLIAPKTIEATQWQCNIEIEPPISPSLTQIAIHAHHIKFSRSSKGINIFPAWLVAYSEFPNQITLYLKLNSTPKSLEDYHLEAEVSLGKWQELQQVACPWYVQLPPARIIMFN